LELREEVSLLGREDVNPDFHFAVNP
jgi:hypothetical protein